MIALSRASWDVVASSRHRNEDEMLPTPLHRDSSRRAHIQDRLRERGGCPRA